MSRKKTGYEGSICEETRIQPTTVEVMHSGVHWIKHVLFISQLRFTVMEGILKFLILIAGFGRRRGGIKPFFFLDSALMYLIEKLFFKKKGGGGNTSVR